MRDVGEVKALHPLVEQLLMANLEGKLDGKLTEALTEAVTKAGLAGRDEGAVDAVAVFTAKGEVCLLHPRHSKAKPVRERDHLKRKHDEKQTFAAEVTPITFIDLSNSACTYIGGKCYCW